MSKIIYSGLEGSGKSLKLAMVAEKLVLRNSKWKKESGVTRPIASNLIFSQEFHDWAQLDMGVPINYWENLDQLIELEQCDVLIDEVGNYFDSRGWQDLSLDARRWLTQGSKMGIELYGTAQDFSQVDKSFRLLVNELIHIRKIFGSPRPSATKPPVTKVWGVCMVNSLNPQNYDADKNKFEGVGILDIRFFLIEKKYCDIFETTQKIKRSKPALLRHVQRYCEHYGHSSGSCDFQKIIHS